MTTDASLSLAIQTLRHKWEENPTHPLVFQLADEYRRIERFDLAAEVLQKQVDSHPRHFSARVALGRCQLEIGEPRLAAEVIEPVVAEDPTHLIANKLLAKAYLELGEAGKARDRLDLYVLLNDDDWEIDELERRLRDLDEGQPSAVPAAQPGAAEAEHLTIEQIEQEVLHRSAPDSLEIVGEHDELAEETLYAEVSESLDDVEPSSQIAVDEARDLPPDGASLPSEEVSPKTAAPSIARDAPEASSGAPAEDVVDMASQMALEETLDPAPRVNQEEFSEVSPLAPSAENIAGAAASVVESAGQKISVGAPPVVPPAEVDEPFQVEPSKLKTGSLKRLLASGGVFSFDSPGEVFTAGKSRGARGQVTNQRRREVRPASSRSSSPAEATVTLGNLYLQQGHHAKARDIFSQVLRREPANLQAGGGIATLDRIGERRLTARDLLRAGRQGASTGIIEPADSNSRSGPSEPSEQKIVVLNQYLGYFKRADGAPKP